MPKFFKFVLCLVIVIGCMFAGGAIGCWWPVRDLPKEDIWAGDGIGIGLYGFFGCFIGAVTGMLVLWLMTLVGFLTRKRHNPLVPDRPRSAWARPDE